MIDKKIGGKQRQKEELRRGGEMNRRLVNGRFKEGIGKYVKDRRRNKRISDKKTKIKQKNYEDVKKGEAKTEAEKMTVFVGSIIFKIVPVRLYDFIIGIKKSDEDESKRIKNDQLNSKNYVKRETVNQK